MTAEARTWQVGVIGVNRAGLFLLEQMSLASDIRLVGAFDQDPARRSLTTNFDCKLWDSLDSALSSDEIDVLFLMDGVSDDVISAAMLNGKQIVIGRPWLLTSGKLRDLAEQMKSAKRLVTIACLRRYSSDFVGASSAKKTGRLGTLHSARFSSCERGISPNPSTAEAIREFGFHWLDQLLVLVESMPLRVFAKYFRDAGQSNVHGFLATIEFAGGCTAQIEVQAQTRLSHRTGWMLEGSTGSYRGDRLYTVTHDGEIVDEPLTRPATPHDSFLGELRSAWRGQPSTLPTLEDAARVVRLIETIEQSAESGEAVLM